MWALSLSLSPSLGLTMQQRYAALSNLIMPNQEDSDTFLCMDPRAIIPKSSTSPTCSRSQLHATPPVRARGSRAPLQNCRETPPAPASAARDVRETALRGGDYSFSSVVSSRLTARAGGLGGGGDGRT